MLDQMRYDLNALRMVEPGGLVIVAVSGGPDSVALLHAMHTVAPEFGLALHVFHMNHGLRGAESAADAQYVRGLADSLGVPVTISELPPGALKEIPGSLQANAREARYTALRELAGQVGATRVALGHTQDDQAETVVMRFLRGAGPRGLAGIPPVRVDGRIAYIRPLLGISRREIEEYCRECDLSPRLDPSNRQPRYLRNRIRLELLPLLAATYNPALAANLAQLATVIRAEDELLEGLTAAAMERCRSTGEGTLLSADVLRSEPIALARRVVRMAARTVAGPGYDLGLDGVNRVLEAGADCAGTREVQLPGGVRVLCEYGRLRFLGPDEPVAGVELHELPVALSGVTDLPEFRLRVEATVASGTWPEDPLQAAFDADRLPGALTVRTRQPGDRLYPVGMEGSKKLQDILVDAKVPRLARNHIPLLVSGGAVLWVIGHRLDRRFLATAETKRAVLVKVIPNPE